MAKDTSKTLRAALTATAPVFFGYIFVGMAFGLLLQKAGYNALWAFGCSLTVYAASMQFVLVELLTSWVGLAQTAVVTLAVQARHAFYGLSLIDKFKGLGKKKPYLIFALTDETYSLLCSVKTPEGCDRGKFYLLISALNQSYWIVGGVLGATIGELVPFNSTGIDFAMTALFIVIFVEQWLTAKSHIPALVGIACAAVCLLLFGTDGFLPPALLLTVAVLVAGRRTIERKIGPPAEESAGDVLDGEEAPGSCR